MNAFAYTNVLMHHLATYGNLAAADRLVHLRPAHPFGCTGVLERFLLGLVVSDGRLDSVLGEPGRDREDASARARAQGIVQLPAASARTLSSAASPEGASGAAR